MICSGLPRFTRFLAEFKDFPAGLPIEVRRDAMRVILAIPCESHVNYCISDVVVDVVDVASVES